MSNDREPLFLLGTFTVSACRVSLPGDRLRSYVETSFEPNTSPLSALERGRFALTLPGLAEIHQQLVSLVYHNLRIWHDSGGYDGLEMTFLTSEERKEMTDPSVYLHPTIGVYVNLYVGAESGVLREEVRLISAVPPEELGEGDQLLAGFLEGALIERAKAAGDPTVEYGKPLCFEDGSHQVVRPPALRIEAPMPPETKSPGEPA